MPLLASNPLRRRCQRALDNHKRRARADNQQVRYTAEDLLALVERSPVCHYCRRVLTAATLAFDHAVPPSRTSTPATWALDNLRVCCRGCNEAKGQLTEEEFGRLLALLRTWPPRAGADVLGRLRSGWRRYGKG